MSFLDQEPREHRVFGADANGSAASAPTLRRELNLFDAVAVVVGTIVGSGIFLIPSTYLRHAYGPLLAFLYAWALLFMIHSGSIAALAVAFGLYAGQILGLRAIEEKVLSAMCILALTTISCFGIRGGKIVQNSIAVAKIGGLSGIILVLCIRGTRPLRLFELDASSGGPDFFSCGLWYRIGCRAVGL